MPSIFHRRSRKASRSAVPPNPSTPDRPTRTENENVRAAKKQNASPRGVADDDALDELDEILSYDEDSSRYDDNDNDENSSRSDEESSLPSESSDDDETSIGNGADDIVEMIQNVFTGTNDNDLGDDDDMDSTEKAYKLCYRLEGNDSNLKKLDIDCDSIGKDIAKEIAVLLPNNSRLQRLCLTCSSSRHNTNNFRILISALSENSFITDIEIRDAELNREAASWVGTALAQNQSVQKICLKDCEFISSGLAVVFMGMQHNKRIEELSILSCDLSGPNSDVVSASLSLMELKSLSLIDASLTEDGLSFLCDNIEKTPSLTQLDLSGNELGRQGIAFLADSLKSPKNEHQHITKLALSSCALDEYCINELVKGLKQNSTLASIDLSQNDFGDPGARHLQGLLKRNNAIKELRVDGCGISSKRKKAIADGLRYNNSFLKSFGFSATTSLAILETVDAVEDMGELIGSSVSEVVKTT